MVAKVLLFCVIFCFSSRLASAGIEDVKQELVKTVLSSLNDLADTHVSHCIAQEYCICSTRNDTKFRVDNPADTYLWVNNGDRLVLAIPSIKVTVRGSHGANRDDDRCKFPLIGHTNLQLEISCKLNPTLECTRGYRKLSGTTYETDENLIDTVVEADRDSTGRGLIEHQVRYLCTLHAAADAVEKMKSIITEHWQELKSTRPPVDKYHAKHDVIDGVASWFNSWATDRGCEVNGNTVLTNVKKFFTKQKRL